MTKGIFLFHRDFRIFDNTSLNELSRKVSKVISVFIFDPKQLTSNSNAIQFMVESLKDLDKQIKAKGGKLYLMYGKPHKVIEKILLGNKDITHFAHNFDYTPYAITRAKKIKKVVDKYGVNYLSLEDYLLNDVGTVVTGSGSPYKVYTQYYNNAKKVKPYAPTTRQISFFSGNLDVAKKYTVSWNEISDFYTENPDLAIRGGRTLAKKKIDSVEFQKMLKNYGKDRNIPSTDTSMLSPHIKFGNVSIREVFVKGHASTDFIKQLYWRDFYTQLMYNFPYMLKSNFYQKYDKIKWKSGKGAMFNKWKKGRTGFPIIDAGMHQLNKTGWMHNRVRMLVASFLTKDLQIDWVHGERYFAKKLVDIDSGVNAGNWQNVAGTGASAQPYFRVMNPELQMNKYDPDLEYVRKWISDFDEENYLDEIVEHDKEKKKAISMYKKAS